MKLMSVSDICSKYNLPRHTVWNWIRRNTLFPTPEQYINNGTTPLFDAQKIYKFMENYGNKI